MLLSSCLSPLVSVVGHCVVVVVLVVVVVVLVCRVLDIRVIV